MPDVKEVFEMVTQQRPPEPGALERQHRVQRQRTTRRKAGVYGLVAAIAIGGVIVAANMIPGEERKGPGTEPPAADSTAVAIAERFLAARSVNDLETILSLLPEEGVNVHPMDNNAPGESHLTMGTIRMDRNELALAFEVERLLQVRYGSVECRSHPDRGWTQVPIVCSYVQDSRLGQLVGIPPRTHSMRIGVRDGRIEHLSFPLLNVSFPGGYPSEGWAFVEWLQRAHPHVGTPMEDGTLFETRGQEMFLILTPHSVDLLADYLDEYERSDPEDLQGLSLSG